MNRKEFLKTSALAAATVGVAPSLMSWIPQHNWEGYNFGSGPEVKDRLYQGPFPVYRPENFFSGSAGMYTTSGKQQINCFGQGLVTYISGDWEAPVVKGETLEQTIDKLAAFPLGTKLYIRPCWARFMKKPGRLDLDDYIKISLEKAAKYNKRICFRPMVHLPQSIAMDPKVPVDYRLFMPDYVLDKVPLIPVKDGPDWRNRNDWMLPEYHNPYFLEYFEEFMALLSEQWNGHEFIEFMDTFMFGFWGEGHAWPYQDHNFPSYTIAEETWIKLWDMQQKYWTKVPLVTNTQPDYNQVGNAEILDRTIRSHNWVRTDSIMIENEQIEKIANRPPWIAAKLEGWIQFNAERDADGLPPTWNLFDKSKDIGANYMNMGIFTQGDTNADNLQHYHNRFPEVLTEISQRVGFRVRPSWVWQGNVGTQIGGSEPDRVRLIFGMVNDGVACVPGVLRLTLFTDENPCVVTGCLDPGFPMTRGVRQAAMVLPKGMTAWESGLKLKAELECKGGTYPVPFTCAQKLNPDGSLTLRRNNAR